MTLSEGDLSQLRHIAPDQAAFDEIITFLTEKTKNNPDVPLPIAIADARQEDMPLTYANVAFEMLTGYSISYLMGRNMRLLQAKDLSQPQRDDLREAMAAEHTITTTLRNYRQDGTLFLNEMTIKPLRDASGKVTHFVSIHHDVTDSLQQERIISSLDQSFRYFMEHTSDLVALYEEDGSVIYVNPATTQTLGFSVQELLEMPAGSLLHPDDVARVSTPELREQLLQGALQLEYRLRCKDGRYAWFTSNITPIYGADGTFQFMMSISRDISEEKYRSEQQFRTMLDNNPDLIQRLTQDGRFLYANQALAKSFGLSVDEIVGKTNEDLGIPHHLLNQFAAARNLVFETGQEHQIQFVSDAANGESVFAARIIPEFNRDGDVETVLVIARDISEIVENELAMRESEARLRRAQMVAGIGSWERNLHTGEITWSEEFFKICGLDPTTTVPSQELRHSLIHPDDREPSKALIEEILSRGESYLIEKRIVRPDGSIRWVESRGEIVLDTQTNTPKVVGTFLDITERKEMEIALKNSESRATGLLNAIPDLVFRLSKDGVYLDFHGDADMLLDKNPDVIGKTIYERLPKDLSVKVQAAITQTLQTGETQRLDHEITMNDGSRRHLFSHFAPAGLNEVIVITRDITEEYQRTRQIERNEAQYASMLAGMSEGVFLYDKEGAIIMCNDAACDITGYTREKLMKPLVEQPKMNMRDENGKPFTLETYPAQVTLRTGEPQEGVLMTFIHHKTGEECWLKLNTRPLIDRETDSIFGVVSTFADITEERRAQEDRFQAAMERERIHLLNSFIEKSSHEFRTPLSVIATNLHLLSRIEDPERRQQKMDKIDQQIQRLDHLIGMQMLMTKLDSGADIDRRLINVGMVVSLMVSNFYETANTDHLTLETDIQPHNLYIFADADYLTQGLQQIIQNAIQYTSEDGTIRIRAYEEDNTTIIQVSDTGVGIAAEDIPFVFNRFWRADKAHRSAGFGLGLSMAHQVVQLHEGTISIESEINQGTTVTIRVPLPDETE